MGGIPESIVTPDTMESPLGTLSFRDGAPAPETVATLRDHLDYVKGLDAFMKGHQGASTAAIVKGLAEAGAGDNEFVLFSELMDSDSLFLTPNADTVYYIGAVSVADGPMVVETPPDALGVMDDMWFRHVIDFGRPGPDRGEGGRFLLVPDGYDGVLPDSGFHVARVQTNRVLVLGRSFLQDNDPAPTVATIREHLKAYPYTPGGRGTAVATYLRGDAPIAVAPEPAPTRFVEASGLAFNTVPPNDHTYFDLLDELVQSEPITALDPEVLGSLAALGIVKGRPFEPDERMQKILTDAAAVGSAAGRVLSFRPSFEGEQDWAYYSDSSWYNPLFMGGFSFDTPPPEIGPEGVEPYPTVGHKHLDARFNFFFFATGITPAMCMRLTGIGSQYLIAMSDGNGDFFDGGKTYKVTLPAGIPQANFWSLTLYDNQTRSMLQTDQRWPRAGSQSFPTPAAEANDEGSTDVYIGPEPPDGVPAGNWIQSVPGKGWFIILRLYAPLEPFFDKSWRMGEIEPVS